MPETTDAQLLRDYAEHRNEAAFRELVHRHTDVVYASALRQVSSPDLAHDIAQSVFTDLARKAQPLAGTLTGDASLLGWLYRSTRFLALNQLRDDRRRQARERQAMENFDPASETAPEWERVQPVLDEAMADLSDEDREALLLRFFKNRDFRAIGATLGVSDDAAQKRVSRALERLRTQLTSRGVTTTAVALSTVMSTNAVPLAPAGLAATLSTAALAGTTLTTIATATNAIAMTTLQKTILGATLAAAVGTGIYEARQASILRSQVQTLQQGQTSPSEEIQQLARERDDTARKLAALRDENERLNRNTAELLKLRGEVGQLRRQVAERSQPEAARTTADTESSRNPTTEAEFESSRKQITFAMLRVGFALRQFMTNNPYGIIVDENGRPNSNILSKLPGLPLDDLEIKVRDVQTLARAMEQEPRLILAASKTPILFNGYWTRSYLLADGSVSSFTGGREDQQFKVIYPPDEDLKTLRNEQMPEDLKIMQSTMEPVMKAYSAANNGQMPNEPAQLTPYVTTPDQQAALQQMLQWKRSSSSNSAPK